MIVRLLALLLALCALALVSTAHAQNTSLQWRVSAAPTLAAPYHLNGVAALSSSDIWAVGGYTDGGSVALHWNGTTWQSVPAPGSELLRIAGEWAVGYTGSQPLIVHWTGSQWQPSHFPTLNGSTRIVDIAALPDGSLWAVGDKDILTY